MDRRGDGVGARMPRIGRGMGAFWGARADGCGGFGRDMFGTGLPMADCRIGPGGRASRRGGLRARGLPVFLVGAGFGRGDRRQGAGLEGGEQGGEFLRHQAEFAQQAQVGGQLQDGPQTTGAQKPQDHRDDTGDGFGQVLGARFVKHGDGMAQSE